MADDLSSGREGRLQPHQHRQQRRQRRYRLLLVMLLLHHTTAAAATELLRYNGEVNIGVLVNLHHPNSLSSSSSVKSDNKVSDDCTGAGLINVDAVQQVIAAKWAVDVINNQSLPHELRIGIQLHDTCNEADLTQKHLFHVISLARDPLHTSSSSPPLLGMIGLGDSNSMSQTSGALHAFNIPLISASPEHSEESKEDTVLTTAPDMSGQARAVATIAFEMDAKDVALISSSRKAVQVFLAEATTMGIRVPRILELNHRRQADHPALVEDFLRNLAVGGGNSNPAVALIVNSAEAVEIAEHLQHLNMDSVSPVWLVGSLGLDLKKLTGWKKVFHGGIFVEPHVPELNEFKKYFIESLQNPDENLKDVIREYKEEMFGCAHDTTSSVMVDCNHLPTEEIELRFQQDPHVSFVVKAVSALTAAFRLVQLDHCTEDVRAACLRKVHKGLHRDIMGNLKKLSFSSMDEGTQQHFTRNGRLVANKQQVFVVDRGLGLDLIGYYSEDEGLKLVESLSKFVTAAPQPSASPLVKESRSTHGRSINHEDSDSDAVDSKSAVAAEQQIPLVSYETFISRTWALIAVSAAILGFLSSLWMLVYVMQKVCDGSLPGGGKSQTMGVLLLAGVMLLFVSVVPWLLPPGEVICAVRHMLHPILLALCFSVLLVKSLQLRSPVLLPLSNQLVSLVFMVAVQAVVSGEWYAATAPIGVQINDGYQECNVTPTRLLLLHIYPAVLLLLSFFYGISVIKLRRNYNEGRWIACATGFSIPVFAAWPLVYHFAPAAFHDPSVAVSVLAVAGILLSSIFLPKMSTISMQSRFKGDDLLSSSRTHSDATVYTGFSDYVRQQPPQPVVYPVYGYTTNQFVREEKRRQQQQHYVCKSAGPHVKSYTDWSREYHVGEPTYHRRGGVTAKDSTVDTTTTMYSSHKSGRGRRHSPPPPPPPPPPPARNATRESLLASSRSPSPAEEAYFDHRQRHSHSPSDGMILTAAGLTNAQQQQYRVSEVFLTH